MSNLRATGQALFGSMAASARPWDAALGCRLGMPP